MKKLLIITGFILILSSCGNDNKRYELTMKESGNLIVFDTETGKLYVIDHGTDVKYEIDVIDGEIIEKGKVKRMKEK